MRYTTANKAIINDCYAIDGNKHTCKACNHTFRDTHYFRKFSHVRNCSQKTEDMLAVIQAVKEDPGLGDGGAAESGKKRKAQKTRKESTAGSSKGSSSAADTDEFDPAAAIEAIAKFFVSTGLPVQTLKNPSFVGLVDVLRPGMTMPTEAKVTAAQSKLT